MHIADLDVGNLGANGIVGGMGIAVKALLNKWPRLARLLSAFRDGGHEVCLPHEAVNMASIWNLPVI